LARPLLTTGGVRSAAVDDAQIKRALDRRLERTPTCRSGRFVGTLQ
jgi:hypothetical protein